VLPGDRHVVVGLEMGELARIALVVAEVRTVAVEHEKEFLRRNTTHKSVPLILSFVATGDY